MPQVSKFPISKAVADRVFDVLIKTLVTVKDKKEADDFAYDLFTPTERIMFAKRLAIAYLLLKNYQYREISKILKVSLTTIGSVSLSLKYGRGAYEKILNRITKEENLEKFFLETVEKLLSFPAEMSKGGGAWRYLRDEVKEARKKRRKPF